MMPDAQILAVSMQPKAPGGGTTDSSIPRLIPQMWVYHGQLEGGRAVPGVRVAARASLQHLCVAARARDRASRDCVGGQAAA